MRRIHLVPILTLGASLMFISSTSTGQTSEIRNEFKKYFEQAKVQGSFSLYDLKNNKFIIYNEKQFKQGFTPASTFKICNSKIGLELILF